MALLISFFPFFSFFFFFLVEYSHCTDIDPAPDHEPMKTASPTESLQRDLYGKRPPCNISEDCCSKTRLELLSTVIHGDNHNHISCKRLDNASAT